MKSPLFFLAPRVLVVAGLALSVARPVRAGKEIEPLPAETKPVSIHAPFEADPNDCSACHEKADPKAPGKVTKEVKALCLECHEDIAKALKRKQVHAPADDNCTTCHNPHNAAQPKLLIQDLVALCVSCHDDQQSEMTKSKVVHGALTTGRKCLNCHDPHGSELEHKLLQETGDLCLSCHGTDAIKDADGKPLSNIKKLLETSPEPHAPVAAKDCSTCHQAHTSANFRLLAKEYPPRFYAAFAPDRYALCFDCHDAELATQPETTTATQFRDGSRNLHYLHVNKTSRGRTCRACHDVHAAKQGHLIRETVPFGPSGWPLLLNYAKTATGGSCAKTCHATKSYDNSVKDQPAKGQ